jgi:type I restriction-modification system DNA methylase subunit
MSLTKVIKRLNLPELDDIISPKGIGARVYSNLVKEKIGKVIKRKKGIDVTTGILVENPDSDDVTQHPIAIICEFKTSISEEILSFTHQLCWNFCRAPLLIVVEPTLVRAFSCYESPVPQFSAQGTKSKKQLSPLLDFGDKDAYSHPDAIKRFGIQENTPQANAAIGSLQWIELVSGSFFKKEKAFFPREKRADRTLLDNLQFIREKLHLEGLEYDKIHDLLARLIFIQFLFQREDSKGQTAISTSYLNKLHQEGIFSKPHENLVDILLNYKDAYKFFRLLNDRFNGDLFPGKKEEAWQAEKNKVKKSHLNLLAEFISGDLHQESRQGLLWRAYSFDTIPLEFISSIYEEFVSQDQHSNRSLAKNRQGGVYYTKSHLVDFVLDSVLPWNDTKFNLTILDPSCGSGIFLVKAFQRLVQRWKNHDLQVKQAGKLHKIIRNPTPKFLSSLLENNLFGVDVDPAAVRVASFSLYLAMCDEMDPITLWEEATFPNLRERQIVARDFFDDDANNPLFKRHPDIKYDRIIGNAPWGKNTLKKSSFAQTWARDKGWETSNNDIGTLFLPKAASLAKDDGYVSLVQPALPVLTAQLSTAEKFRKQLFTSFHIEEIVNLSDLRFVLFEKAVSPPCIITLRPCLPNAESITYICPKKKGTDEDFRQIFIEPRDVNSVTLKEAIDKPWIWATLMWGTRPDVNLIGRLRDHTLNIEALEKKKIIRKRRGIYRSDKNWEVLEEILNVLMLDESEFPSNTFLSLNASKLLPNKNSKISKGSSRVLDTFRPFQTFLKLAWTKSNERFQAVFVENSKRQGILCSSAYFNIQSDDSELLKSIATTFCSSFTTYYLLLTDGRFAFYRPEPSGDSFWQVPIAQISASEFSSLCKGEKTKALRDLDQMVFNALQITNKEQLLIRDIFDYTLSDFKGKEGSNGRQPTSRKSEPELTKYCETIIKVLKAGFGQDKKVKATIFQENDQESSPVRIVAIHFEFPQLNVDVDICDVSSAELWERLKKLNETFLRNESANGNIFYQRVGRIYDNMRFQKSNIPTVYIIKPDQKRYWIESQALVDAEEISADIRWNKNKSSDVLENKKIA